MAYCRFHPDRPGIGICMKCRQVICLACTTRLDGINHCHACLKRLAQADERRARGGAGSMMAALLVLTIVWLVLFGIGIGIQGRWAL